MDDKLAQTVGSGFFMGQVISIFQCATDALKQPTHRVDHFIRSYPLVSLRSTVEAAQWNFVSGVIGNYIPKNIHNLFVKEILSGALTGAILNWRDGFKAMGIEAVKSVGRTILLSGIQSGLTTIAQPMVSQQLKGKELKKFNNNRNNYIFVDPFESFSIIKGNKK